MQLLRIAQVETRSWGENPRNYTIRLSGIRKPIVKITIISPWERTDDGFHLFLVSDDLCLSKLPFYIPRRRRIALLKESPLLPNIYEQLSLQTLLDRFSLVITHQDAFAHANKRSHLVPYSSNMLGLCPYRQPVVLPSVSQKSNLCSAVLSLGADLFSSPSLFLRQQVIEYLSFSHLVDLFGRSTRPIENKADALMTYFFSVAMENTVRGTYFTEKLIDCILAGAIPIYHGPRSVANYFDERGIIFFNSLSELNTILSTLSIEKYVQLRKYAEKNFKAAINLMLGDYHGYLHRVCEVVTHSVDTRDLQLFRLSTSPMSRLTAGARYAFSFLPA